MLKNLFTLFVSIIISFIIIEIITRITIGHPLYRTNAAYRFMFFEKGENFQNIGQIFKYFPNREIISKTYYIKEEPQLEYAYTIHTNNLGLVQKRDVHTFQQAEIILGDSFTEGQGASAWFYDFDNTAYQRGRNFINGGILGTGPMQWNKLKEHLELTGMKFSSTNVIIIGADLYRNIWNFDDDTLQCLHYAKCDKSNGDYYGYDFANNDEDTIKKSTRNFNDTKNYSTDIRSTLDIKSALGIKYNLKAIVKRSAVVFIAYRYFKDKFSEPPHQDYDDASLINNTYNANLNTVKKLVFSGENPGFLLLVTMKHEVGTPPKWDTSSRDIIQLAKENNLNFHTCILEKEDFYTTDSHPNQNGYSKINTCVSTAAGLEK